MKLIFSLIATFCVFSAQAEVIIYKHAINVTQRTDGTVRVIMESNVTLSGWTAVDPQTYGSRSKITFKGWTVVDIQTGQLGLVTLFGKNFQIQQPISDIASFGRVNNNVKAFGIMVIRDGSLSGLTAKGINKSIDIGFSENWTIPKTLAVTGSQLSSINSGFFPGPLVQTNDFNLNSTDFEIFKEFKGSMVFDRANTLQANSQTLDFAAALLHLKDLLVADGYIFYGGEEQQESE